jgi:hypothetical protein
LSSGQHASMQRPRSRRGSLGGADRGAALVTPKRYAWVVSANVHPNRRTHHAQQLDPDTI